MENILFLKAIEYSPFIITSLFTFSIVLYYLDDWKLSNNNIIKVIQIFSFILLPLIIIILAYNKVFLLDFICAVDDKNNNLNIHGHVSLDKDAGKALGKGLSTIGSQIGLGASIVGIGTAVGKVIAKSSMPPLQKAGVVIGGGIIGGLSHSIISTSNRNTIEGQNNLTASASSNNLSDLSINKLLDDSFISPLQEMFFNIYGINSACLGLIIILCIQLLFKLYVKDNIKFKFSERIGIKSNNTIEYYLNKIIILNKKMSVLYIWLIIIILFVGLSFSIYGAYELYSNLDAYVDVYLNSRKK